MHQPISLAQDKERHGFYITRSWGTGEVNQGPKTGKLTHTGDKGSKINWKAQDNKQKLTDKIWLHLTRNQGEEKTTLHYNIVEKLKSWLLLRTSGAERVRGEKHHWCVGLLGTGDLPGLSLPPISISKAADRLWNPRKLLQQLKMVPIGLWQDGWGLPWRFGLSDQGAAQSEMGLIYRLKWFDINRNVNRRYWYIDRQRIRRFRLDV